MNIDIIIPTLNESINLKSLLPYLKDQINNTTTQIFVVDAAKSSDNSADICREFDVFYTKSRFSRRSIQMNEGAKLSQADYYNFIHADVFPPNHFLREIKEIVRKQGFKFGLFSYRMDPNKGLLKINSFCTRFDGIFCGGGDQCHFVEKETFENLGQYDNKACIMEDFLFFDKIKKHKIPYKLINKPARVSSRKYLHHSYLKVTWYNTICFIKYKLGKTPEEIAQTYESVKQ